MQRRSFIQSLLAVPAIAALARFIPSTHAEVTPFNPHPDPITDNLFKSKPLIAYHREPTYKQFRAATGIRKGSLLRETQFGAGVVPMDSEPGGWFAGVSMHDAMEGEMVKVMTEGMASVRFQ